MHLPTLILMAVFLIAKQVVDQRRAARNSSTSEDPVPGTSARLTSDPRGSLQPDVRARAPQRPP